MRIALSLPSRLLLLLVLGLFAVNALAAVKYVVWDQFRINMRTGPAQDQRIITVLSGGAPLTLMGGRVEGGYIKVRDEKGRVGYVLSRFLGDEPSPLARLERAEQQVAGLRSVAEASAQELEQLRAAHEALESEHRKVQRQKQAIEQQLESFRQTLAEPVKMAEERDQLRQSVAQLIRQSEALKQEKRELENRSDRLWFLAGAGVVILGILLGLLLPSLRTRRRSSSWESL